MQYQPSINPFPKVTIGEYLRQTKQTHTGQVSSTYTSPSKSMTDSMAASERKQKTKYIVGAEGRVSRNIHTSLVDSVRSPNRRQQFVRASPEEEKVEFEAPLSESQATSVKE